ncbi:MAG: hypothetical protein FH758_14765 [Firmicutes bacterium]|nr:hypothetical protein [Bacillota bacterium]
MDFLNNQEDSGILEPNAFTLFLILILLVLGTGRDFEERLVQLSNVMRASHNAVKMMRAGMNEVHTSMAPNNEQRGPY